MPATAPITNETETAAKLRMVSSALGEGRLTLAYQPVMSTRTSSIPAFHECLVRIVGQDGETVPAGLFMPEIEGTDLGRLVDRQVLRLAIKTLRETPRLRLSVNISACGVGDDAWLQILRDADEETPGITDFLIVEITETSELTLDSDALAFLYEVRRLGCSIALDDFGAGHAKIQQLGKFRFDFLKVDMSLCQGAAADPRVRQQLRSILQIVRHFDMVSVAEGVETEEDAKALTSLGFDCLQGYHCGRPAARVSWLKGGETRFSATG